MPNRAQLSAMQDNQTGLIIGEGFLEFRSSAGNILKFNDPASYTAYLNNPSNTSDIGTPDSKMTYNDMSQSPTSY